MGVHICMYAPVCVFHVAHVAPDRSCKVLNRIVVADRSEVKCTHVHTHVCIYI